MPGFSNILLVQMGDIGDVVLTTPAIRAVREVYQASRVSILVRKPFGNLLLADPNLHEVIETERIRGSAFKILQGYMQIIRRLRRAHYDLVIDLRTGDHGALLTFFTGAPVRVGVLGGKKQFWRKFLFTNVLQNIKVALPPTHPGADQSLRIVREIGIDTADSISKLYIAPADRLRASALLVEAGVSPETRMVTVNPFSRWKYKEWNNSKWGEVIDQIWETHHMPAVLIGSPEEAAASQEIVAGREGRVVNLAGKTTLGELAAVLSMSALHMGVDSAAPHIAAAVGTPTVTIHGPSDWRTWRIIDGLHKVVIPAMECVPCSRRGCDDTGISQCLGYLEADAVIEVVGQALQKPNPVL